MTRDDIIRMAEEAGFIYSVLNEGGAREYMGDCFERFAALVAAAEREACARIADSELANCVMLTNLPPQSSAAWNIAAAIRERNE